MPEEPITSEELTDFLNKANKHTYAADGPKSLSARLKSEDFEYKNGNLAYHDTYFGERSFIGEEIVYKSEKPIWGMNYFGFILDNNFAEKEVYAFLKQSLMQEEIDIIPIRGPKSFELENWKYQNNPNGELSNFSGQEEILFRNKVVYRCFYHGGYIR